MKTSPSTLCGVDAMQTENKAQELFDSNQSLAYYILHKNYPRYTQDEDLRQDALLGLWQACLTFEEGKAQFSTYAGTCILNSLRTAMRQRTQVVETVSLDQTLGNEDYSLLSEIVEDPKAAINTEAMCFKEFWKTLTEKEKYCMRMCLDGCTQVEVAKTLGVTRARVSQVIGVIRKKYQRFKRR